MRATVLKALAAALLIGLASPAPSSAQTPQERQAIDWALQRGRLLYDLDRAAWVATDDLVRRMPNPAAAGVRGFLVERDGPGFAVTFYGGTDPAPVALYRGTVRRGRVTEGQLFAEAAGPPLTPAQRRLVAARNAAATTGRRPCGSQPFNTAIVPPEGPDTPIDVYLMTPQVRQGEFPFGGHYRATVGADGTVTTSRAFTNSCLAMSPPRGAAARFVNHLLESTPTEIQVVTALASGVPVAVGTDRGSRTWLVTGQAIRPMPQPQRR